MSSWTAASSDCSRPVNNYVHVKTADLYRPNARLTPERQGYQVLTPFGKLGHSPIFYLMVTHFGNATGGFGSLAGVAQLFDNEYLLLAGWVHFLAFDLFVGAWEVRDARRLSLRHVLVVPCLILTFMLGPVGLLAYLGVRAGVRGHSLAWRRPRRA